MADSQYDPFLQEATTGDPACDRAPGRNRLYGLYTSRCFPAQAAPAQEDAFRRNGSTPSAQASVSEAQSQRRPSWPATRSWLIRMTTTSATYRPRDAHQENGDNVTNNDSPYLAAPPAAAGAPPTLNDLDLSPQGLADARASEVDPDSLAYPGNS